MPSEPNKVMQLAIQSALTGIQNKEGGPFGACVAQGTKIISVAHNTVLKDRDPTCHAEMNAIRQACKKLGTHSLEGYELYTTAEPCPMCLSAIYWARLDKIHVGVERDIAAKYGFDDAKFYEQVATEPKYREISQSFGVMGQECEHVFSHWKELEGEIY